MQEHGTGKPKLNVQKVATADPRDRDRGSTTTADEERCMCMMQLVGGAPHTCGASSSLVQFLCALPCTSNSSHHSTGRASQPPPQGPGPEGVQCSMPNQQPGRLKGCAHSQAGVEFRTRGS